MPFLVDTVDGRNASNWLIAARATQLQIIESDGSHTLSYRVQPRRPLNMSHLAFKRLDTGRAVVAGGSLNFIAVAFHISLPRNAAHRRACLAIAVFQPTASEAASNKVSRA